MLDTSSEFSASLHTDLPLPTVKPWKTQVRDVTRVVVREMAVQTLDPAFTYQWAEGEHAGPRREAWALGACRGHPGSTVESFGSSSVPSWRASGPHFLFQG